MKTVAVLGTGVIGAGWAARLLFNGIDVIAYDPDPAAAEKLRSAIAKAQPALAKLSMVTAGPVGQLHIADDLQAAVAKADFIQENAPERLDVKQDLLVNVSHLAGDDVIIASSTSGFMPSILQQQCRNPQRVIVGHPFNPVYLLPLVEVVAGKRSSDVVIAQAMAFYRQIGMHPLHVRKEIDGHLSDRLQEALWREALHLVNDGVATTDELDQAVIYGPGLRWAIMGTCLTFHLAGGDHGMRHMLEQFGPALKLPWTKLEAPELSADLIEKMVAQTQAQGANKSIVELEQLRDACLVAIMQSLRSFDYAAGATLKAYETRQAASASDRAAATIADADPCQPLRLHSTTVQPDWIDYNGHMTEARYLQVFGDANDAVMRHIGVDAGYLASGFSYYTVETHIRHLNEVSVHQPLVVASQVISADAKRMHLFHALHRGVDGPLLATGEHMMLHVDQGANKAVPAKPAVLEKLLTVAANHAGLDRPDGAGRFVGQGRG